MSQTESEAGPSETQRPNGGELEKKPGPPSEDGTDCTIYGQMRCPMCRSSLLYPCGDVISRYYLRPGVTILPQELQTTCPLYQYNIDAHTVPLAGRPLHPASFNFWDDISRQLAILGGEALQGQGYVPWDVAHPGAHLFREHEEDDLYGLPNVIPTDGELHMNIPNPPEGFRNIFVPRPPQHNFRFRLGSEDPQNLAPGHVFTKSSLAVAIENEWPSVVNAQIGDLRERLEAFGRQWPDVPVPVTPGAFATLTDLFDKLKVKYLVFRRQHEGFIQLSPLALCYRDDAECELQARLDDFWDKFEWVRQAIEEAVDSVSL
ncbi:hypothetical protein F4774DRAFT_427385 [Daldinia eschscholtzii]|nr:hypothetical protein F4774DRAFT_427385 [Daldinia eschscholtzii]